MRLYLSVASDALPGKAAISWDAGFTASGAEWRFERRDWTIYLLRPSGHQGPGGGLNNDTANSCMRTTAGARLQMADPANERAMSTPGAPHAARRNHHCWRYLCFTPGAAPGYRISVPQKGGGCALNSAGRSPNRHADSARGHDLQRSRAAPWPGARSAGARPTATSGFAAAASAADSDPGLAQAALCVWHRADRPALQQQVDRACFQGGRKAYATQPINAVAGTPWDERLDRDDERTRLGRRRDMGVLAMRTAGREVRQGLLG